MSGYIDKTFDFLTVDFPLKDYEMEEAGKMIKATFLPNEGGEEASSCLLSPPSSSSSPSSSNFTVIVWEEAEAAGCNEFSDVIEGTLTLFNPKGILFVYQFPRSFGSWEGVRDAPYGSALLLPSPPFLSFLSPMAFDAWNQSDVLVTVTQGSFFLFVCLFVCLFVFC